MQQIKQICLEAISEIDEILNCYHSTEVKTGLMHVQRQLKKAIATPTKVELPAETWLTKQARAATGIARPR